MDNDFLSYIEEKPVFCTKCDDQKYLDGGKPCSNCNLDEYKEWDKERRKENLKSKKKGK